MDEDIFNTTIRSFLKTFGVTRSARSIRPYARRSRRPSQGQRKAAGDRHRCYRCTVIPHEVKGESSLNETDRYKKARP